MIRRRVAGVALCVAWLGLGGACHREAAPAAGAAGDGPAALDSARLAVFAPLPAVVPPESGRVSQDEVTLGRMLYYDPRLSRSQTISCNTCHDLAHYGVDGQPTSDGFKGQTGTRNSPTVFNAAAQFAQFWDGRAANVEEQAKGPMLNPVEMALASPKSAVAVIASMPEYVALFRRAFPGEKQPVTFDSMALAIGAFERGLMTPSAWDRYLKGDESALTPAQLAGLQAFLDDGCQACHNGALLGGTSYQKLGLARPYPGLADPGRYDVTKVEADRGSFKVPSLRNVDRTAPYFHDGEVPTLDEAVRRMGEYQVGKTLSDEEIGRIVTFLKVLTGPVDAAYVKPPALPRSTAATPKPEND